MTFVLPYVLIAGSSLAMTPPTTTPAPAPAPTTTPTPAPTPAPSTNNKSVGDQYELRRGAPTWPGSGIPGGEPAPRAPKPGPTGPTGPITDPLDKLPPVVYVPSWTAYGYGYNWNGYYDYGTGYRGNAYTVSPTPGTIPPGWRAVVVNTATGPQVWYVDSLGPVRFDSLGCTPTIIGQKPSGDATPAPAPSTGTPAQMQATSVPQELFDAGQAFIAGKYEQAGKLYEKWLATHPNDGQVIRALGICELLQVRLESGCSMIRDAYERDEDLINQPMELGMFPDGAKGLDRLLDSVRAQGARTKRVDAYVTELSLMQVKGRVGPLLRVLERAESAGLSADTARRLRDQIDPARKSLPKPIKK